MNSADLIVCGARRIDGLSQTGDLVVIANRIAAVIGDLALWRGRLEIDAAKLALAPGFIDSHGHDDLALMQIPLPEPKISQGSRRSSTAIAGSRWRPIRRRDRIGRKDAADRARDQGARD